MKLSERSKFLIIAAGGVLFYIALPIIDSGSNLIQSAINAKIARMQMKLEEDGAEHQSAVELIQPNNSNMTNAVGFQVASGEDYE